MRSSSSRFDSSTLRYSPTLRSCASVTCVSPISTPGRTQFVREISGELQQALVAVFEAIEHRIERCREPLQFGGRARHVQTRGQVVRRDMRGPLSAIARSGSSPRLVTQYASARLTTTTPITLTHTRHRYVDSTRVSCVMTCAAMISTTSPLSPMRACAPTQRMRTPFRRMPSYSASSPTGRVTGTISSGGNGMCSGFTSMNGAAPVRRKMMTS